MNIQNFFRPVKLVDSDCEVEGDCSSGDEAFQNIYQPTESDKEFIASDDEENGEEEKQRFLDFMKDEEDARRWREHCAQKKDEGKSDATKKTSSTVRKAPPKKSLLRPVVPKPHFVRPAAQSSTNKKVNDGSSIPTFLIRTRKYRRPKKKRSLPILVQQKKRKKNDAFATTKMLYYHPPATKKKGRRQKSPKATPGRTPGGSLHSSTPGPYQPYGVDDDQYFLDDSYGKNHSSAEEDDEEPVRAVAKNFCLIRTK